MRAIVYDGPSSYRVRDDVDIPEPEAEEIRVKIIQTGVCGTDLHIHKGEFLAEFPLTPGHETVGIIDAIGTAVNGFRLGQQVVINPNVYCAHCDDCRAGRQLLCNNFKGHGSNLPGFFAEYQTVRAVQVFDAEGMAPDTAVLAEPAACAMHGLETAQVRPGSSALVFGAGPTGLLLAQLLATGGAAHVTVAAPTAFKLETARALGIDQTVQIERDKPVANLRAVREASSGGAGYDLVVEATGAVNIGEICVPLTRAGGTVLVYGVTGSHDTFLVEPYDVFRREITIKGSFAEMSSFGAALRALRSGRVRTNRMITHRFPLEDYDMALDAVAHDATAHKVVIVL